MIFLDANVVLRYLIKSPIPVNQTRHEVAANLFAALAHGEVEATTSEAVLAEVAFVLSSKRQYGLPASDVADYLAPLIRLPGLKLPRGRKRLYLRALEYWSMYPRLGFVDALTAVIVEQASLVLATFDSDFDRLPSISRWHPNHIR